MFKGYIISELIEQRKKLDKRFTKATLYRHADITQPSLDAIINGTSQPKVSTLELIADCLEVDMNCFFERKKKVNTYAKIEPEKLIINENPECYQSKRNPWELLFEKQEEITELKLEIERLKNARAPQNGAKAG